MSARTPPARDNERWVAESLSTNGATADGEAEAEEDVVDAEVVDEGK